MHWLEATSKGFDLFTDHNKLIYIFDLLSIVPDMSQTTFRKDLRRAVRLTEYNYTCVHISGEDNIWADLLGRWNPPQTIRRIVLIPVLPSTSSDSID